MILYPAIDLKDGQAVRLLRGEMDAADEAEVVRRLQREGKLPLRAEPAGASVFAGLLVPGLQRGLRRGEAAEFVRELSVMLSTGQDLDRALRFLAETAPNPRVGGVVGRLRDVVRDGGALAAAMAGDGRSFLPLLVGLVRAGEAGGGPLPPADPVPPSALGPEAPGEGPSPAAPRKRHGRDGSSLA